MSKLSVEAFLDQSKELPVIDVRSPAEFARGHIPGAYNLPLFDNRERARVGTTYKQIGKEEAILLGLELVGPKMRSFVEEARRLAFKGKILVHCWRGGMRSESFAWLLQTAGLSAETLEGGYKAYRGHLLSAFQNPLPLIVVGGETGSGKTAILQALAELGEQIIDLEALACHRGSAFGGIGLGRQPSSEQFQNDLYTQWRSIDSSRRVWMEDESFSIGGVQLPLDLWNQMKQAPMVKVSLAREERISRLVEEYGKCEREALVASIMKIQKRLGGLETHKAIEALEDKRLEEVADILLFYYDKSYQRCLAMRNTNYIKEIVCNTADPYINALAVKEAVDNARISSL